MFKLKHSFLIIVAQVLKKISGLLIYTEKIF